MFSMGGAEMGDKLISLEDTCQGCGLGVHPGVSCAILFLLLHLFPWKVCEMAKEWPNVDRWADFLELWWSELRRTT